MATQRAPPRRAAIAGPIRDSSRSPAFRARTQRLLPTPPEPAFARPWQVTDELLADIERADSHAHAQAKRPPSPHSPPSPPYIPYRRPPNAPASPPLQTITPDRSLPVQEIEDEPAKNGTRPAWSDPQQHVRPPTPQEARSPAADLPEDTPPAFYPPARRHTQSFDPAEFEGDTSVLVMGSDVPPQYTHHHHRPPADDYAYTSPKLPEDELHQYDSSYLQSYYQSPRPDAPVPPTPHSQTAAPTPSPHAHYEHETKPRAQAPVPPPPAGSPYPYPFNHFRRPRLNVSAPAPVPVPAPAHPTSIHLQLARQWEIYARNHHAAPSDTASAFSPTSTPFEGAGAHAGGGGGGFAPWALLHTSRTLGVGVGAQLRHQNGIGDAREDANENEIASMRSSPSHEPLEPRGLPPALGLGLGLGVGVGGVGGGPRKKGRERRRDTNRAHRRPPPRVESTQPRDTSPDLSSSSSSSTEGEETAGEEHDGDGDGDGDGNWSGGTIAPVLPSNGVAAEGGEEGGEGEGGKDEWVDEEEDEGDLLEVEYHPRYVRGVERRRRRWEVGWEGVLQAVQTLDRETDATIILMASPSHTTSLYALASRSLRRHPPAALREMRGAFGRIAAQRRGMRSHATAHANKVSLVERFLSPASAAAAGVSPRSPFGSASGSGSGSGSVPNSTSTSTSNPNPNPTPITTPTTREETLQRALEAALGSLASLGEIYERREARWREEMGRVEREREGVGALLRGVFGAGGAGAGAGAGACGEGAGAGGRGSEVLDV